MPSSAYIVFGIIGLLVGATALELLKERLPWIVASERASKREISNN